MAEHEVKAGGTAPADAPNFSLSRWSRLKRQAAREQPPAATALDTPALMPGVENDVAAPAQLELPPISSISLAEDFTPFMQARVPQALKQQALKALFKEPHFNVMDGLDTYIDDYTQFEPIPPEVLETLAAWKAIKNPPQQVVTPGGYAVDVESEEGRAVLAARARQVAERAELAEAADARAAAEPSTAAEAARDEPAATPEADGRAVMTAPAEAQHARYGSRVGDFSAAGFVPAVPAVADAADAVDAADAADAAPHAADAAAPTTNKTLP